MSLSFTTEHAMALIAASRVPFLRGCTKGFHAGAQIFTHRTIQQLADAGLMNWRGSRPNSPRATITAEGQAKARMLTALAQRMATAGAA